MSVSTRIDDLFRQLLALERAQGSEGDGAWDLLQQLRAELDQLPDQAVFDATETARHVGAEHGYWECVHCLRTRGTPDVFQRAALWAHDTVASRRQAAADVLAQLGYGSAYPFAEASWPILRDLLKGNNIDVIASALFACGLVGAADR